MDIFVGVVVFVEVAVIAVVKIVDNVCTAQTLTIFFRVQSEGLDWQE